MEQSVNDADSKEAPTPPKPQKKKKKASKPSAAPKALIVKPLATAPPEPSVHSEDLCPISKKAEKTKKTKKPKKIFGHELTPVAILRNEDKTIDLSSDEDLGDDVVELLIKSKQEAEIFNDLPLFDVDMLKNQ